MSEKPKPEPSDKEVQRAFIQHPGVRSLEGVDDTYMSKSTAAKIDLLNAEAQRKNVGDIARDSVTVIRDVKGNETSFYRTSNGDFELLTETEKGEVSRTPVEILGSSASPTSLYEKGEPSIVEGAYLQYGTVHTFKSGLDEGVPENFRAFPDVTTLDSTILQENINMGLVARETDGSLAWRTVQQQPPIQQVESAVNLSMAGAENLV